MVIHTSASNRGRRLQGRIASEKNRVAYTQASEEPARPEANDRLVVDPVGDANPWLEIAFVNPGVMLRNVTEQKVEFSSIRNGDSPCGGVGETVARDQQTVVTGA